MSEARLLPKELRALPVYTRATLGGLLLLALAPVIKLGVNIIQSYLGALPVNLITAIISLAIAGLARQHLPGSLLQFRQRLLLGKAGQAEVHTVGAGLLVALHFISVTPPGVDDDADRPGVSTSCHR